jgi:hypothetical protein
LIQSNNERTKGKRRRARPRAQGATQSGKEGEAGEGCAWLLIQSKFERTKGKRRRDMTNKEAYELVRADWKHGHHLIDYLWLYQYNRKYMRLIRKCIQHEKKMEQLRRAKKNAGRDRGGGVK